MSNTIKTTLLLGGLTGLFLLIGSALGGTTGMIFAFGLAVVMNLSAWWFSDRVTILMSGAKEVAEQDAPALHQMVAHLAQRANMPKPKVYLMDTPMPNAFATGRSPQRAAVAVTTGLMNLLNQDELAGVIAHELAHIKHRDTLISSIAATVGGAITMLADMVMWGMMLGGLGGEDEEDNGLAGAAGGLMMMLLAPIAAVVIQLAISRSREFSADAGGARILGDPMPLANALAKLENHALAYATAAPRMNPSSAHLYIVPPIGGGLMSLFRTHPVTSERIARLRGLAQQPVLVAA